ncbi:nitrate- and nitrite sensing domain-containing protein [Streptomyces sp. NPDC059076]|uniref:sensor histidine kinase n=1 Tax=unclassified Streptomyces TaxID=2593676 RepID=UPI0036C001D3
MQGRYKRDGSAAAEPEPQGGTDRGSSPQHTQNQTPTAPGEGGTSARPGAAVPDGPEAPKALPKAKGPNDTGSRLALRNWRISTRLVSLLTLPVVAATTLGGLRINESMERMEQLEHMQLLTNMTQEATRLAVALQNERDLTAGPLSNEVPETNFKITNERLETDRARAAFLETTRDISTTDNREATDSIRQNANIIVTQITNLTKIRENAYAPDTSVALTVQRYHRLIESLLSLSQDMAQATSNPEMIKRTRALAAFSSAKEYASMQRAIIASALPGGNDSKQVKLDEDDREYGLTAFENGDDELQEFERIYTSYGGDAAELTDALDNGNPIIAASEQYASQVFLKERGIQEQTARSYLDWTDDYTVRIDAMNTIEATLLGEMEAKARQLREESQQEAIINGALILFVLGVSLVGAFVVARSMIRSLRRLQDTATKVAQERLPELVKHLSESDPQDVDTSVESVGVHSRDEIGKVAAAFDDVHREAVRLAAEQALLRGNVNAMFTNLSRRSQGLIQRQLSLISELESREADPDQLSSLFKLDHLATRMRRNGENLLVLAGEEPGRRWTRPVPLVDVLRAAASEVEQYERIELASVPTTEVAGRVVNDLVHLLAELLENATSFSSPQTKVRVTGHALPDGRVLVEIHDTGIGLSPEDLAAINERLASPPTVDVSVSRRMGLFVVGRLSLRHGIRIQLRPSDSGGTTALVMLPVDVAQGGRKVPLAPGAVQGAPPIIPPGLGGPATTGNNGRPGISGPGGSGPGASGGPQGAPGGLLGAGAPPRGQVGAGAGSSPAQRAALPSRDGGPSRQSSGLAGAFGGAASVRNARSSGAPGEQARPGQQQDGDHGRQLPPSGGPRPELPGSRPQRPQTTSWGSDQMPGGPKGRGEGPRGHADNEAAPGPATAEFARPDFSDQQPEFPAGLPQRGPVASGPGEPSGQFVRPDVFGPPANAGGGASAPAGPTGSSAGQFTPPGSPAPGGPQSSASTEQFARPDFGAPTPQDPTSTGQFPRPDFGAPTPQDPTSTGQFPRPDFGAPTPQDPTSTGQFPRPDFGAPQPPLPGQAPVPPGFDAHPGLPAQHALPPQPQPEALPPAGPGDGRTPLFDTLETDWFHTQGRAQNGLPDQPVDTPAPGVSRNTAEHSVPSMPQRPTAGRPANQGAHSNGWRPSPNDELVRQAERLKKPTAGGVTTSGLPRRVPRANLVAGTAQEQSTQSGPQVSRAPDDVRGRLTNLRRGIQQGRQQNTSTTGSFNLGPTHPQER